MTMNSNPMLLKKIRDSLEAAWLNMQDETAFEAEEIE